MSKGDFKKLTDFFTSPRFAKMLRSFTVQAAKNKPPVNRRILKTILDSAAKTNPTSEVLNPLSKLPNPAARKLHTSPLRQETNPLSEKQEAALHKAFEVKGLLSSTNLPMIFFANYAAFDIKIKTDGAPHFVVANEEEFFEKFCAEFPELEQNYEEIKKDALEPMNIVLNNYDFGINLHGNVDAEKSESASKFFIYDEHRAVNNVMDSFCESDDHLKKFFPQAYLQSIADRARRNITLEMAITALGFDVKKTLERLSPNFVTILKNGIYARDDNLTLSKLADSEIYHANPALLEYFSTFEYGHNIIDAQNVGLSDAESSGFKPKIMPFFLEGGNVVQSDKRVHFCTPHHHFDENNNFISAPIINENGDLEIVKDHEQYIQFVEKWFKENGYEPHHVERRGNPTKYYHLDTFFNIVGRIIFVFEEALAEGQMKDLKELYLEKKFVKISPKDWENLATNFIAIDDHNFIFTTDISDELKQQLLEMKINFVTPKFHMGQYPNDGVRCSTAAFFNIASGKKIEKGSTQAAQQETHKPKRSSFDLLAGR